MRDTYCEVNSHGPRTISSLGEYFKFSTWAIGLDFLTPTGFLSECNHIHLFHRFSEQNRTYQASSNRFPEQDNHFPHSNRRRPISRGTHVVNGNAVLMASDEIKPISPSCTSTNKASSFSLQEYLRRVRGQTQQDTGFSVATSKCVHVISLLFWCAISYHTWSSLGPPQWKFDKHSFMSIHQSVWWENSERDEIESASWSQEPSFYTCMSKSLVSI